MKLPADPDRPAHLPVDRDAQLCLGYFFYDSQVRLKTQE